MPDEKILHFLTLVIDKEEDVQLQIEAAMAINNMGEIGRTALQKLLNSPASRLCATPPGGLDHDQGGRRADIES